MKLTHKYLIAKINRFGGCVNYSIRPKHCECYDAWLNMVCVHKFSSLCNFLHEYYHFRSWNKHNADYGAYGHIEEARATEFALRVAKKLKVPTKQFKRLLNRYWNLWAIENKRTKSHHHKAFFILVKKGYLHESA